MDWETKRNAAKCCNCALKIDLRDYGYTAKSYKSELVKMQESQKRILTKR